MNADPVIVNVSVARCQPFPALLAQGRALALAHWADDGRSALVGAGQMAALLQHWPTNATPLAALCRAASTVEEIASLGVQIESMQLHAPIAPRQVFCTIGNYRAQLIEAALDADDGPAGPAAPARRAAVEAAIDRRQRDGAPYVCIKSAATVAGAFEPLVIEPDVSTLDWEVEIGVVIGRPAWRVPADAALDHVAGYCVVNDLTLRERVFRQDPQAMGTDWLQSKSRPGWLPAGPWLVPRWALPDPARLRLWLRLNGQQMQGGEAGDMLFSIAEQIAYLSQHTRLEPGDLLCSGSPAGFGAHHRRFLRPGDLVEAGVDGLGAQSVPCTAEPSSRVRRVPSLAPSGTARP